jgi:hypothetical protein
MLQPLLSTPDPGYLENYDRIVAFAPASLKASFRGVTGLLHHNTTIKLVRLLKLINNLIRAPESHRNTEKSFVSPAAALARRFMQCRHADWYFQSGDITTPHV